MTDPVSVTQLLPCPNPWCDGSNAEAVPVRTQGMYAVECQCGMRGPEMGAPDRAITAWNTRPTPDTRPAAAGSAREALEKVQDFLREPDHAEHFGTDQLLEWINRRPTHIIPKLLAAAPTPDAAAYDPAVSGLQPVPGHADGCGAHDDYDCDCTPDAAASTSAKTRGEAIAYAPKGHLERYLKGRNTACWVYGSPTAEDNDVLYRAAPDAAASEAGDDEFNRGVLIAVSTLINAWGESTQTEYLLRMIDADTAMVERMDFTDYDRGPLLAALTTQGGAEG